MNVLVPVILLLVSIFILVKSADLTLKSIKSLTRKLHVKAFIVSSLILAFSTTLPELFVGITSALKGSAHLSLGNIMGANIVNLSLVTGVAALIAGGVVIKEKIILKELFLAGAAAVLPIILILDGSLSKVDGTILIFVYLIYTLGFFKSKFIEIGKHHIDSKVFMRFVKNAEEVGLKSEKTFLHFLVGMGGLLLSSNFIVSLAEKLATVSGLPLFIVGMIILSVGTTLPEMVISIESLEKGQSSIFFGSILGSVVINSTFILGLVSLVSPIVDKNPGRYLTTLVAFAITFLCFWIFTKTKSKISRSEAFILLLIYIIFATFILLG